MLAMLVLPRRRKLRRLPARAPLRHGGASVSTCPRSGDPRGACAGNRRGASGWLEGRKSLLWPLPCEVEAASQATGGSEFVRRRGANTRDQVGRRPWRRGRGVLTTLVRDMHAGIASRVSGAIGPAAKPTQILHDAVARTIYGGVDGGIGGDPGSRSLASKAGPRRDQWLESQPTSHSHRRNRRAVRGSADGTPQRIRAEHADPAPRTAVPLTADGVAAAFPTATVALPYSFTGCFSPNARVAHAAHRRGSPELRAAAAS